MYSYKNVSNISKKNVKYFKKIKKYFKKNKKYFKLFPKDVKKNISKNRR